MSFNSSGRLRRSGRGFEVEDKVVAADAVPDTGAPDTKSPSSMSIGSIPRRCLVSGDDVVSALLFGEPL